MTTPRLFRQFSSSSSISSSTTTSQQLPYNNNNNHHHHSISNNGNGPLHHPSRMETTVSVLKPRRLVLHPTAGSAPTRSRTNSSVTTATTASSNSSNSSSNSSTACSSLAQIMSHAGYMNKLGQTVREYKRRFFVLCPSTYLYYFLHPTDASPRGCIDLHGCTITRDGSNITITTSNHQNVVQLQAKNDQAAEEWLQKLTHERLDSYQTRLAQLTSRVSSLEQSNQTYQQQLQWMEKDCKGAIQDAKEWKHQYLQLQQQISTLVTSLTPNATNTNNTHHNNDSLFHCSSMEQENDITCLSAICEQLQQDVRDAQEETISSRNEMESKVNELNDYYKGLLKQKKTNQKVLVTEVKSLQQQLKSTQDQLKQRKLQLQQLEQKQQQLQQQLQLEKQLQLEQQQKQQQQQQERSLQNCQKINFDNQQHISYNSHPEKQDESRKNPQPHGGGQLNNDKLETTLYQESKVQTYTQQHQQNNFIHNDHSHHQPQQISNQNDERQSTQIRPPIYEDQQQQCLQMNNHDHNEQRQKYKQRQQMQQHNQHEDFRDWIPPPKPKKIVFQAPQELLDLEEQVNSSLRMHQEFLEQSCTPKLIKEWNSRNKSLLDTTIHSPTERPSSSCSNSQTPSLCTSSTQSSITENGTATTHLACPMPLQSQDELYHITFFNSKIGLQFQKVPTVNPGGILQAAVMTDASSSQNTELERIKSLCGTKQQSDKCPTVFPKDVVLVCGFQGFDDALERPKLGARLVAFDGISIEVGPWTFERVHKAIRATKRPLTLTFRNEPLTSTQRTIFAKSLPLSSTQDSDNERFRTFSEASSSASTLIGPLVSSLMNGLKKEPFTPSYLRRESNSLNTSACHHDFEASLL